ncbi:MAG TPA: hypothetical protein VFO58_10580, partial [Vicinamibacterales bacterium]|nr:hypothetical protein [Vicinamibacterales bacterium]
GAGCRWTLLVQHGKVSVHTLLQVVDMKKLMEAETLDASEAGARGVGDPYSLSIVGLRLMLRNRPISAM